MSEVANSALPLSRRLKDGTASIHEQLDKRIMAAAPFSNRQRYAGFLRVQLRLHHVTAPLYCDPRLQAELPCLVGLDRLEAVQADCADLDVPADMREHDRRLAGAMIPSRPEALGWIYIHEGSRMGAAILLKEVERGLGLSAEFGARHMAAHPDGRAPHWRRLKAALDALDLTAGECERAVAGARAAFRFVQHSVDELITPIEGDNPA